MPELIVEKAAIEHNAAIVIKTAADAMVIGVVKGNGYGMGLISFAHILLDCGVKMLAVSSFSEAMALRKEGIENDILMLNPLYDKEDVKYAILNRLTLCIPSFDCGEIAEQTARELALSANAHLKIDTGLGRYGFLDGETDAIIKTVRSLERVRITGIFSHLFDSFGKNKNHTKKQYDKFMALCRRLEQQGIDPGIRHLASSCAMLRFPETRLDAVRVGSAFLGRFPLKNDWGFEPVGWLRANIEDIYQMPARHNIGYGNNYTTKKQMTTAVVPVGYTHGYGLKKGRNSYRLIDICHYIWQDIRAWLRSQKNYVEVNGHPCQVLGCVGFCSIVIDITGVDCNRGDEVKLPINPLMVNCSVERRFC